MENTDGSVCYILILREACGEKNPRCFVDARRHLEILQWFLSGMEILPEMQPISTGVFLRGSPPVPVHNL